MKKLLLIALAITGTCTHYLLGEELKTKVLPYTTSLRPNSEDISILFLALNHNAQIFGFITNELEVDMPDLFEESMKSFAEFTNNKVNPIPDGFTSNIDATLPLGPTYIIGVNYFPGNTLYREYQENDKDFDVAWVKLQHIIDGIHPKAIQAAQASGQSYITITTDTPYHKLFKVNIDAANKLLKLIPELEEARKFARANQKAKSVDEELDTFLNIGFVNMKDYSKLEVKQMYKKLMLKYHPDKNPKGEEISKQITKKWSYLLELYQK